MQSAVGGFGRSSSPSEAKLKGLLSPTDPPRLGFTKQCSVRASHFSKCFQFGDVVGEIFASKSVCSVKQKGSGSLLCISGSEECYYSIEPNSLFLAGQLGSALRPKWLCLQWIPAGFEHPEAF